MVTTRVMTTTLDFISRILVFIAPVVFTVVALGYLLSVVQIGSFVTKKRAVVLSLAHSFVILAVFFSLTVTGTVSQAIGNYDVVLAFGISVLIVTISYLSWGIPNIVYDRCRECGHEVNLGRLYCGHCGSLIVEEKKIGQQAAWLLFGYSVFVPLSATLFQFLSPLFLYSVPFSVSPMFVSLIPTPSPLFITIIVGPFLYLFFAPVSMISFGASAVIRRFVARVSSR